jgi:hypothetical protein
MDRLQRLGWRWQFCSHQYTLLVHFSSLVVVLLLRNCESHGAVSVFMAIPVHERRRPLTGLLFASKGSDGVVGLVFVGAEQ